jgi:hypothetical protein
MLDTPVIVDTPAIERPAGDTGTRTIPATPQTETIIVRGERVDPYDLSDIEPELTLTTADIEETLAFTVSEVLDDLPPTREGIERVTLVNGKPGMNPRTWQGFPAKAIEKVEVLPIEASVQLGFSLNQQVTNITLKEDFSGYGLSAEVRALTNGGQLGTTLGGGHARIEGDNLLRLAVTWAEQDALEESERDFDDVAALNPDFGGRTLVPSNQKVKVEASVARNLLGHGVSAFAEHSEGERESVLGTALSGSGLESERLVSTTNTQLGFDVNSFRSDWRYNASASYSLNDNATETLTRDAQGLTTFDSVAQTSTTLRANGRLMLPPISLSRFNAMPIISATAARTERESRSANTTSLRLDSYTLTPTLSGQFLPNPDAKTENTPRFMFGTGGRPFNVYGDAWSYTIRPTWQWQTDRDVATSLNLSLYNQFFGWLRMTASVNRAENPPSIDNLEAPLLETANIRVFDFATGQNVDVTRLSGGNPDLATPTTTTAGFNILLTPEWLTSKGVRNVSLGYEHVAEENSLQSINEPLPALEAAFPDRFIRDAQGNLLTIDTRPVNFESQSRERLFASIGFSRRFDSEAPFLLRDTLLFADVRAGYVLSNEIQLGRDNEPVDLLAGAGVFNSTAAARRDGRLFLRYARQGVAIHLETQFQGRYQIIGQTPESTLDYSSLTTTNAELRLGLEKVWGEAFKDTRLRIEIDNLFNARRAVTNPDGQTPMNFSRDLIDPEGRSVTLTLARNF